MARLRFLERLRIIGRKKKDEEDETQKLSDANARILRSVMNYLSQILNIRRGSSVLADDFGVPDFSSMGSVFSREDIPDIERSIAEFVCRCEPRLRDVHIAFMPDSGAPLHMVFSLSANILGEDDKPIPIYLLTRISKRGEVSVSS